MDPDANLARQRELTKHILLVGGRIGAECAEELAALAQSLDEWLTSGGFPPRAWNPTVHSRLPQPPAGT